MDTDRGKKHLIKVKIGQFGFNGNLNLPVVDI